MIENEILYVNKKKKERKQQVLRNSELLHPKNTYQISAHTDPKKVATLHAQDEFVEPDSYSFNDETSTY